MNSNNQYNIRRRNNRQNTNIHYDYNNPINRELYINEPLANRFNNFNNFNNMCVILFWKEHVTTIILTTIILTTIILTTIILTTIILTTIILTTTTITITTTTITLTTITLTPIQHIKIFVIHF